MADRKKCIDNILDNNTFNAETGEWIFECRQNTSNQHYVLKLNADHFVNDWREMSMLVDKVTDAFESGPCLNCERCG